MPDNNEIEFIRKIQQMESDGVPEHVIKQIVDEYNSKKVSKDTSKDQFSFDDEYVNPSVPKERNPFVSFGKMTGSTIVHGGESGVKGTFAGTRSGNVEIGDKYFGGYVPVIGPAREGSIPLMGGVVSLEPTAYHKQDAMQLIKEAIAAQERGREFTKGLVTSMDQIEDPLDALNWASTALGQAAGQIPINAVTYGTAAMFLETGEIYLAGVHKIAQEKGITPEEVIEKGLDEPAFALAYGFGAAALESVGAEQAVGLGTKLFSKELKGKLRFQALKSGLVEAPTEFAQTMIENIGSSQVAGKSFSESTGDIDYKEAFEAAAQGFIGGVGLTGSIGYGKRKIFGDSETKTTPESKPAKKSGAEMIAELNSIIENATKIGVSGSEDTEIANEIVDETAKDVAEEAVKGSKEEELLKELEKAPASTTSSILENTTSKPVVTTSTNNISLPVQTTSSTTSIEEKERNIKKEREDVELLVQKEIANMEKLSSSKEGYKYQREFSVDPKLAAISSLNEELEYAEGLAQVYQEQEQYDNVELTEQRMDDIRESISLLQRNLPSKEEMSANVENKRNEELKKVGAPKLSMSFIDNKTLVAKDVKYKLDHEKIKDDYKEVKKIIECLWK